MESSFAGKTEHDFTTSLACEIKYMNNGVLHNSISFNLAKGYFLQRSMFEKWLRESDLAHVIPNGTVSLWIFVLFNSKCTPSMIVQALGMSKSTISSQVDSLEAKGLVKRVPSVEDGRSVYLVATEKSEPYREQLRSIIEGIDRMMAQNLSVEESNSVLHLLQKISRTV